MSKLTTGDRDEGMGQGEMVDSDFPRGIGNPARRALHAIGYTSLDQLTSVKESDLLHLHGMGPKATGLLREALRAREQSFADPEKG